MTTFCLLHGKWHEPSCWEPLIPELERRGHDAVTPDIPIHDPDATWAERTQPAVDALGGVGDDVVVVGHSLSSGYAPLVAAARRVSAVVHLCPVPTGLLGSKAPMRPSRPGFPFPPDDERGASVWERDTAIEAMYPRLEPVVAGQLADRLRPGSSAPDPYPLERHPDVHTRWIYAVDDEFFVPEWHIWAAREILGVEPEQLPTGHFPMAEDPELLADVLTRPA